MDQMPLGYLPAGWHPPEAVWLAWPHHRETWPGRFHNIPAFFAKLACQISRTVPVRIIAAKDLSEEIDHSLTGCAEYRRGLPIETVTIPTNDCWIRDFGPVWVCDSQNTKVTAIDFRYNAWGEKYPPWDLDQAAAARMATHAAIPCVDSTLCMEGGAIESDGQGRLLTTRSSLITSSRNPGWCENTIASELHRCLGVTEIVWLGDESRQTPLAGDDTDGHVDQLARFLDSENVVVAVSSEPTDPNRENLEGIYRQLKLWGQTTQPRVVVHRLQTPPPRFIDKQRVPESYCNFLRLGPNRLLLPSFGHDPSDAFAEEMVQGVLPDCEIERVDCRDVVWGLGALHCLSLQQPSVQASREEPGETSEPAGLS